jgi:hypothetical protein
MLLDFTAPEISGWAHSGGKSQDAAARIALSLFTMMSIGSRASGVEGNYRSTSHR